MQRNVPCIASLAGLRLPWVTTGTTGGPYAGLWRDYHHHHRRRREGRGEWGWGGGDGRGYARDAYGQEDRDASESIAPPTRATPSSPPSSPSSPPSSSSSSFWNASPEALERLRNSWTPSTQPRPLTPPTPDHHHHHSTSHPIRPNPFLPHLPPSPTPTTTTPPHLTGRTKWAKPTAPIPLKHLPPRHTEMESPYHKPFARNGDGERKDGGGEVEEVRVGKGMVREGAGKRDGWSARVRVKERERVLVVPPFARLQNLVNLLGVPYAKVRQKALEWLSLPTITPHHILTAEYIELIAMDLDPHRRLIHSPRLLDDPPTTDTDTTSVTDLDADTRTDGESEKGGNMVRRPPIVAVMGHVDHGKTSLLDALREAEVAKEEDGGITQRIGTFEVTLPTTGDRMTFLDTPGHAAFEHMRSRGAMTTDIVVLVVAANDGVMPQTREAIGLVKKARVPVVVAVSKVDLPEARMHHIKSQLSEAGLLIEEYGGDVPLVQVSALKRTGLVALEEAITSVAEVMNLMAVVAGPVRASVVEAQMRSGQGNTATLLIKSGTLRKGAIVVSGVSYCKVRKLLDSQGRDVADATPGTGVEVLGWKTLPTAGEPAVQVPSEAAAARVVDARVRRGKMQGAVRAVEEAATTKMTGEAGLGGKGGQQDLEPRRRPELCTEDGRPVLPLVVKADSDGSLEAVLCAIETIDQRKVSLKVVGASVGDVGSADIFMARTTGAHITAFSTAVSEAAQEQSQRIGVPLSETRVIYTLISQLHTWMADLLPKTKITHVVGTLNVRKIFSITLDKHRPPVPVAGCRVTDGHVRVGMAVQVLRAAPGTLSSTSSSSLPPPRLVYEGMIKGLRHFKDDVPEVRKGMECGVMLGASSPSSSSSSTAATMGEQANDKDHGVRWLIEGDEVKVLSVKYEAPPLF